MTSKSVPYKEVILGVVLREARNTKDVEDLFQNACSYILQELKKYPNIQYLDSWVLKTTKNFCKRYYKKKKFEIKTNSNIDINNLKAENEQYQPENMFIKKETPHIRTLENLRPEIKKGLEISLEWIKRFYVLKKLVSTVLFEYMPIVETLRILSATKKKIKHKLPLTKYKAKKLAEKYRRRALKYQRVKKEKVRTRGKENFRIRFIDLPESEPGKFEFIDLTKIPSYCIRLDNETKEKFKFGIHTELDYLIESTLSMFGANLVFRKLYDILWFSSPIKEDFIDFIKQMPNMQIRPENLIFMVWHKAVKKGKYANLKQIKELLLAFKDDTKGTDKEFLFSSLRDSVSLDSLRIAFYRNNKKKKYKELANFIYQKSFIEKVPPILKTTKEDIGYMR